MPMGGMPMGGMPTGGGGCGGAPGSCGSSGGGQAGGQIPANMPSGGSSTLGPNLPPALQQDAPFIESASQQTGVPANILAAQVWQESRGDPNAGSTNVNGMTDQGLMQVDPATFAQLQQEHPQLQGKSLSDPATNVLAGAYYMSDLYKQFGSWPEALRAYNSGPDQVNPSNLSSVTVGDPNYVNSVMNFAATIQNGGQLPA
ncbi:transglycosylase SLT domain-containing protein [Paraburkholderia sp. NMBU_R16]|nr:transglycosylase SLT domain-containing protein [Paraburkholderia sp. NMBU_R16]